MVALFYFVLTVLQYIVWGFQRIWGINPYRDYVEDLCVSNLRFKSPTFLSFFHCNFISFERCPHQLWMLIHPFSALSSLILFDQQNSGFYIHGRSPHQYSETSLQVILHQLDLERVCGLFLFFILGLFIYEPLLFTLLHSSTAHLSIPYVHLYSISLLFFSPPAIPFISLLSSPFYHSSSLLLLSFSSLFSSSSSSPLSRPPPFSLSSSFSFSLSLLLSSS